MNLGASPARCSTAANIAQLQNIQNPQLFSTVETDSASLTPSNAGHVLLVQLIEDIVMAGVCITTMQQQNVSSVPAPVLHTGRVLAPHAHSLQ